MARNGSIVSVLQFGPGYLSYVKLKPGTGGPCVVESEVQRGDWSREDGSLQRAVKDFAAKKRLAGTRLFTVLPRHEATLRVLELPTQSDEEIRGMVRLSAEEIVPFSLDDLVTAHSVLENLPGGSAKVLAVVVHRDIIDAHLGVLRDAGLDPEQVFLSTACLMAAAGTATDLDNSAIVNLSPGGIEILILKGGIFTSGRGIASEHSWADPELGSGEREELTAEVRTSLAAHRRESGDGAEVVVVSSECTKVAAAVEALGGALDVPCRAASQLLDRANADDDSSPLVAVGAAVIAGRSGELYIGLLPKLELKRRAAASTRLRVVRAAVMFVLAAAAASGAYWQAVSQRSAYLDELEVRAEALRPFARGVRMKRQHLKRLQSQVEREATPLELLATISSLAPESDLNITRFSYDREQGITLRGRALNSQTFDRLIDDLRGSGARSFEQFAQAQELYRTLRRERDREVWDFAVSIPFLSESEVGDD